MKKLLSVVLAFIMVLSVVPVTDLLVGATDASGTCGTNLTWSYDETAKVLTISGTGKMTNFSDNGRPWEGYASSITTIVIKNGLTEIGTYAFASFTNLASVTVSNSVKSLGANALKDCSNLKTLYYSGTPEELNTTQVANNSLAGVKIYYNHVCDFAALSHNGASHPHYAVYKCACGALQPTTTENYAVVTDVAVAPTCTETGKTEGSHCSICKMPFVAQNEIPATGHTVVVKTPGVAATCTTAGKTAATECSVCGITLSEQTDIPATGHKEVIDAAVSATCTAAGKTEGKHCGVCNLVIVAQNEIPATGHKELVDAAVAPTCTAVGKTEGKHCSLCGEVFVAQKDIPATGHTNNEGVKTAPTCTEAGYTTYTCSTCNKTFIEDIVAALGHNYVFSENQADHPHYAVYKCGGCNGTYVSNELAKVDSCAECNPNLSYKLKIKKPSRTDIRCYDGIILHAEIEGTYPKGAKVVWSANNYNFVMTKVGDSSLKIVSANNGYTVFTATLVDASGKDLGVAATIQMHSKAGLFDRIGGFFRNLFGTAKVYPN